MNLLGGAEASRRGAATIGIRPEHLSLSTSEGRWQGKVSLSEHLGSDTFVHAEVAGLGTIAARAPGDFDARRGDTLWLTPDESCVHRFDAQGRVMAA
jgi:multiple sugar transport system ATP-binding protein